MKCNSKVKQFMGFNIANKETLVCFAFLTEIYYTF